MKLWLIFPKIDERIPLYGRITFLRRPKTRKDNRRTGKRWRVARRRVAEGSLLSLVVAVLLLVPITGSLASGGSTSATPTVISMSPSSGAQGTTVNVTDLEDLDKLARYADESRAACWWRRARFSAVHPGEVLKLGPLSSGLKTAYENAAAVTYELAKELASRSNDR